MSLWDRPHTPAASVARGAQEPLPWRSANTWTQPAACLSAGPGELLIGVRKDRVTEGRRGAVVRIEAGVCVPSPGLTAGSPARSSFTDLGTQLEAMPSQGAKGQEDDTAAAE